MMLTKEYLYMISQLFQELMIGIFLTLPIVFVGSQCEKRYLVHCKQPISFCRVYRIGCLLLLFVSIHQCLPRFTSKAAAHDVLYILYNVLRYSCIVLGIHLGQVFCPIAITGSIATGKSTVVQILLEKHVNDLPITTTNIALTKNNKKMFRIIDTDKIGHDILLSQSRLLLKSSSTNDDRLVNVKDSVYAKILNVFGDKKIDNKNILNEENEIDRRKLGDIIFQDRIKRKMLNRITHPQIIRILIQQLFIGTYLRNEVYVCADVPLLYESSYTRYLFCCVIVVACSPDLQYERLRKRNPDLTEIQCRQRIASQIPIEQKISRADVVIWNNGTYDNLSAAIEEATNELRRRMQHGHFSWLQYVVLVVIGLFLYLFLALYS